MADNVIRVNVTTVAPKSVTIQGSKEQNYINATGDTSGYNAQLAKNWAIGEGKIQGIDYSSKHYAGVAKENAELSSESLSNVQEIVAGFGETAGNATNELAQAKNDALIDISNLNSSVIEGVETAKDNAISSITTAGNKALESIENTKETNLEELESTKNNALAQIDNVKTEGVEELETQATEQIKVISGYADEIKNNAEDLIKINRLKMFQPLLLDYILPFKESKGLALQGTYVYKEAIAGSRYGYSTFYEKCVEEKASAIATETTLGDNTITMYINANGHQFYDIADKEAIDAWYSTYGRAWFYGIDTENERIFLPRNSKYFRIGDESTVGSNQDAGLPNITGTAGKVARNESITGAFYGKSGVSGETGEGGETDTLVHFNASRSSSLYGNSDTVEVDSVNMLLYICVGNTESEEAVTDVIDITTTENDTIPLGYSTYQNGTQPSVSWLKSEGQWNDGNVYTTFYNEFVQKIGEAFASGYIKEYTEEYDDYDLVINQDEMTFRLPLLDGSEDLPSGKFDDLTLSKEEFVAPANGFVHIEKLAGDSSLYLVITVKDELGNIIYNDFGGLSQDGGENQSIHVMVCKGWTFRIDYNSTGTTKLFRFYYAQGNGSLYFKVANAVQNLELLNAGEVLEAVQKIGAKPHIIETYQNGTSWYIVYSNGWCEQGSRGETSSSGGSAVYSITFLKPFKDTNYNGLCSATNSGGSGWAGIGFIPKTNSTAEIQQWIEGTGKFTNISWRAYGYIA